MTEPTLVERLRAIRTTATPTDFKKWVEDWAKDSSEAAQEIERLEKRVEKLEGALRQIAEYTSPDGIRAQTEDGEDGNDFNEWGLTDANETIEMAYENVIISARQALKGQSNG